MYSNIKKFIAIVNRASLKDEKHVRMTTADATKLNTEISLLLLELKEHERPARITTLDGGKF
jgi:hypothetical protein